MRYGEMKQLLTVTLLTTKDTGTEPKVILISKSVTFYRWSLSFPPSPSRDVLMVFLNRTSSPSGKRIAFGPLQWHCWFKARDTAPGAALIAVGFPFFFLWSFLSTELWKQDGVRGTQSCIISAYCFQNAVSEPLPSPLAPTSQTSSRPPTMCWPCAVKPLSPAPLRGGNSSVLSEISCRNPTVHQHLCISS